MYRLSFVLLAFLLSAIPLASQQRQSSAQAGTASPYEIGTPIPGLPDFRVEDALNDSGQVRALLVYQGSRLFQSLNLCTSAAVPRTGELGSVAFSDFNFDGHPDLAMLVSSANENNTYCVWLFDPQTRRFALSQDLSRLTNPAPAPDMKTVVGFRHITCGGVCYERQTYVWSGNRLVPASYEAQTEDPALPPTENCRFVRTVKESKNGRMVDVRRERVDQGGIRCVPHGW